MPKFKLTKTFRFETAHRLVKGYVGKCNNLHGHSWNGSLTVEVTTLNDLDIGVDYTEMKSRIISTIEDELDHGTMLQKDDPLVEHLSKINSKLIIFDENPTSEVIAKYIFDRAKTSFKDLSQVKVHSVEIMETCTSSCVYTEN